MYHERRNGFTANQLVLYYTDTSKYANEVNVDNWYEVLQEKGVIWGHSEGKVTFNSLITKSTLLMQRQ